MEDFAAFQGFTVFVAILSCGCMLYTGLHSESRFDNKGSESDALQPPDQTSRQSAFSFSMLRTLMWQILINRDFQLFVLMNFFQVFMLAFFNNFTMIFAERLIPPDVLPSLAKSLMYGAGFICPQVLLFNVSYSSLPGSYCFFGSTVWTPASISVYCLKLSLTGAVKHIWLSVTYNTSNENRAFWQPTLKVTQMSDLRTSTWMHQRGKFKTLDVLLCIFVFLTPCLHPSC